MKPNQHFYKHRFEEWKGRGAWHDWCFKRSRVYCHHRARGFYSVWVCLHPAELCSWLDLYVQGATNKHQEALRSPPTSLWQWTLFWRWLKPEKQTEEVGGGRTGWDRGDIKSRGLVGTCRGGDCVCMWKQIRWHSVKDPWGCRACATNAETNDTQTQSVLMQVQGGETHTESRLTWGAWLQDKVLRDNSDRRRLENRQRIMDI